MCTPVGQPLTGHTGPVFAVAFSTGAGGRALLASRPAVTARSGSGTLIPVRI
jgi:hypothetical protein